MKIKSVQAFEILDSRGNPTVRCCVILADGTKHFASVPSGASTGSNEAVELRDNDLARFGGKGVLKAAENVNTVIAGAVLGQDADPKEIDKILLDLDGTPDKKKLGANSILSVSMAIARAAAHGQGIPLWQFLNKTYFQDVKPAFPQLMVNIINGGKHANWNFDIQEFMIVPNSNEPSKSIRTASEIFHSLGKLLSERNKDKNGVTLKDRGLSTLVGDEGGYSPSLSSNEEVFEVILEAAKSAGYDNVKDYRISIDSAATEFFKDGKYNLHKPDRFLTSEELTKYYQEVGIKNFILSFEDAFAEDDWDAFQHFEQMAEQFEFLNIGDDLFTTNPTQVANGIKEKLANGVIIKLNQIGTLTETVEAIKLSQGAHWKVAVSHRSGETEDPFIADLAYSCGADFLKAGSMSRSERLSKYNRLLEIEKGL